MLLPRFEAKENTRVQINVFSGLNRRDKISGSELTEMVNMSADAMPALAPREPRKFVADVAGATAICAPEYTGGELSAFTGVRGTTFYYDGKAISGSLTEGQKSIADFNGKICIFPDKVYYDYIPSPDTGEVKGELVSMEKTMTISGAKFYSSYSEVTGEYTSYISASGADFVNKFSVGDSIVISGSSKPKNNTKIVSGRKDFAADDDIVSVVVEKVASTRIDLILHNKKGEKEVFDNVTEANKITLKRAIPDMDHICVHNNRLWGTAVSGEYVYASKLGDCTNFYSYQGLSDDSWYGSVGTGGEFTGICSYRSAVVAFKRGCIHHIYGDAPVNFSMPKQTAGGCIDARSVCEVGGILYYLSYDGFKAYSGGEPYDISPKLKCRYTSCASGSDGRRYMASAVRENGERDVLVYTPETDVWVREDDTPFVDFCSYNGEVYGITNTEMYRMRGGSAAVKWSVVSKRFTYDVIEHKGLSCLWIRADMEKASSMRVLVSRDGADFVSCGEVDGARGFSVHRIPVRFGKCESFRVMLEGEGKVVLHDIEISTHNGGRIM